MQAEKDKAKVESEKEYHAIITDPSKKETFFASLCRENSADHEHVEYIKSKISKLVKQELEYLGFKN